MLRTLDVSSALERSLQTRVYDLHTSSVALDMQDMFARRAEQILPLLAQVDGEVRAAQYRRRFSALMDEYKRLGMPKHPRDKYARAYLESVRRFSDDLRAYIETEHPIEVEFSPSFSASR
jgi:hypothetical protein